MTKYFRSTLLLLGSCVVAGFAAPTAPRPSYRVVANAFSASSVAHSSIAEVAPRLFYSTASAGGDVLLSVTAEGRSATLAAFSNAFISSAPGIAATDGLFYSSLSQPAGDLSSGFIFSVGWNPGTEKDYPLQTLGMAIAGNLPDGKLFGFLGNGATWFGLGTADLQGNVTPFYQFPSTDLPTAFGAPIRGWNGNFYGVAEAAQANNAYFYRVTPSGSASTVAALPFYVSLYRGGGLVLEAGDGNFYGVQSEGLGCPNPSKAASTSSPPAASLPSCISFAVATTRWWIP